MDTDMKTTKKERRKAMWKVGCSGALYSILNKEFENPMDVEEKASSALSGGMMQLGQQCGMLWGSSMAAGAESYRRNGDPSGVVARSISSTQDLMQSWSGRTRCNSCREYTRSDFSKASHMVKYMLFGTWGCFSLLKNWAPEALQAAREGLTKEPTGVNGHVRSCASEVVKKMGGSEQEMAMVSGFAGGMGLSGNACGALAAAVWMRSLESMRNGGKLAYPNPAAKKTIEAFKDKTGAELKCREICRRTFDTIDDHTKFIDEGGCRELIITLAKS